jgi:hypothetical protein
MARVKFSALILMLLAGRFGFGQPISSGAPIIRYVTAPEALHPYLRSAFYRIGARVGHPGAERVTAVGTLTFADAPNTAVPVRIIYELPGKLRIDVSGTSAISYSYGGNSVWSTGAGGKLNLDEQRVVESLVADFVDQLFYAYLKGAPVGFLGSQFRLDDGTSPNYSGPFYDVFSTGESADSVALRTGGSAALRLFMINCQTKLLDMVRYPIERGGNQVQVETDFQNWTSANNLYFPQSVTRMENGAQVFTITFSSVSFSSPVDDTIFAAPTN